MASIEDVARLRRLVNEPTDANGYDAIVLGGYVDTYGVTKAAAEVWREKAAKWAALVDTQEGSSSRRLSQLRDGALKMAQQYDEEAAIVVVAGERPFSRAITRG